jgi:hypothetical protein
MARMSGERYTVVRMYDPEPYGAYDNAERRLIATAHDFFAITELVRLLNDGKINLAAPDAQDPTRDA